MSGSKELGLLVKNHVGSFDGESQALRYAALWAALNCYEENGGTVKLFQERKKKSESKSNKQHIRNRRG